MATIAFAYRSIKDIAPLQVRLLYRLDGSKKRFSIYGPTKFEVSKTFWEKYQSGIRFSGENKDKSLDLDNFKKEITDFILDAFKSVSDKNTIDKDWLKKTVHEYYNPPQLTENKPSIPETLLGYFDFYIDARRHELSNVTIKKLNVIKRKLQRYNGGLLIKDINDDFKNSFVGWCKAESYSINTIGRELKDIKTIVKHARIKGVEVHSEHELLKLEREKTPKIYLDFEELQKIQEVEGLTDYLDNARDWLLISCYTGQRISDFMRFNKSMIRIENDVPILEFTQVKTGAEMAIPILPEVKAVLDKRGGDFPRRISDQRYNEWIKKVCDHSGIHKMTKGKVSLNLSNDKKKTKMRNVFGLYPKWQLITSHVGRRSFATNYYGKLPTTFLIGITGHSTEKMFLNYIGKGQKDLVFDAYKQLLNAKH